MELLMTYDKYVELGGTASESTFNISIKKAQMKLNFLTNNRLRNLETIPDEVYELLVRMVDIYSTVNVDRDPNLTSYSNGIESFGYAANAVGNGGQTNIDRQVAKLVTEYLCAYPELLSRGKWQWKQDI